MSRHPRPSTQTARKSLPAPRSDRDGASKRRCDPSCVRPTPAQAHCADGCHRTFGGATGFDAHRKDGHCIDPTTLGMTLTDTGIWRTPMSDDAKARLTAINQTANLNHDAGSNGKAEEPQGASGHGDGATNAQD